MANELLTLSNVIEKLKENGLTLTRRTFQYYVQAGLLPKGIRRGSEKGGVQFYYSESIIKTIRKIFDLKNKGRSLNEIRELILSEARTNDPETAFRSHAGSPSTNRKQKVMSGTNAVEEPAGFELLNEVMRLTPGGDSLKSCLQCGTCSGSCPSSGDMDHTPRKLFSMLHAGLNYEVLSSNTPWFCVSCYCCTTRCPQQIPVTEIMYTLKQLAVKEGISKITDAYDFARTFVELVEKYGRSFDFGLSLRYHLTHNALSKLSWGSLALQMYKKERMVTGPSKISGIEGLGRILRKAKNIGGNK
ncbi:MAG TPA: 4Fe-4S dicluster domain-containing protein [Dissulfurispiraceae bacterium]|nr:4Fe-4S dicluster domain-containing protein [Dissulfurispiraceae bacterium]